MKAKKAVRAPTGPDWSRWQKATTFLNFDKARGVAVTVALHADGAWGALALESNGSTAREVLENHAHHVIGEGFASAEAAMLAGEAYMREPTAAERCACKDTRSKRRRA